MPTSLTSAALAMFESGLFVFVSVANIARATASRSAAAAAAAADAGDAAADAATGVGGGIWESSALGERFGSGWADGFLGPTKDVGTVAVLARRIEAELAAAVAASTVDWATCDVVWCHVAV